MPEEFEEEKEKLVEVTIEVDELVFYTSEEEDNREESSQEGDSRSKSTFKIKPTSTLKTDLKKNLSRKRENIKS